MHHSFALNLILPFCGTGSVAASNTDSQFRNRVQVGNGSRFADYGVSDALCGWQEFRLWSELNHDSKSTGIPGFVASRQSDVFESREFGRSMHEPHGELHVWETQFGRTENHFVFGRPSTSRDLNSVACDSGARPLILLLDARRMLGEQRITEARKTLRRGVAAFPKDKRIADLHRAIAPGRSRSWRSKEPVKSRERESEWLRQHGRKYLGLWVAVSGYGLMASAPTLHELMENVKAKGDEAKEGTPIIHKVLSDDFANAGIRWQRVCHEREDLK